MPGSRGDKFNILLADLTCNENEINVDPNFSNQIKNHVQCLVSYYKKRKNKSANIQLKICVKSDESMSHQPRRLPFTEKKLLRLK